MTKKPDVYEIDILRMELEKQLPHWLDPMQRYPEMAEAIRMKHREQWLAEQEKKKAWPRIKAHAESTLARARDFAREFDPNQERDEFGKWTDGGGSDSGSIGGGQDAGQVGAQTGGTTTPAGGEKASPGVPAKLVKAIEDHVEGMGGENSMEGSGDLSEWIMRTQRDEVLKLVDASTDKWPIMLLHKGDVKTGMPTVWLLSWSKADNTSIHDHVDSEVGVSVVRGKVGNRTYTLPKDYFEQAKKPGGLDAGSQDTMLHNNATVTLTAPYIHEMYGSSAPGEKRDVTVHAYYPPLKVMHYFKKDADGNLHYDGDWDEDRPEDEKNPEDKKKNFCFCCARVSWALRGGRFHKFEVKQRAGVKGWYASNQRDWDESEHPRDPDGKFGSGGGGGGSSSGSGGGGSGGGGGGGGKPSGAHPGAGYSKNAYVKNGVIHTTDVDDAALALHEGRKVELDQPRKVSVLLDKLGRVAKDMIAKGEAAPTFNLCNVSVTGTNLFCVDNKGIARVEMPQLDDEQTKQFQAHLEKTYNVKEEETPASHLRATQNELNGAKVAGIAEHLRNTPSHYSKRIIVSKDDYVLDGHHHWAAKIGLDAADGVLTNDTKIPIARVDISIVQLLEEAEKFTGGKGKKPASESGTSKQLANKVVAAWATKKNGAAP